MLQLWEAERFEEEKETGRTRPLVIECALQAAEPVSENVDKSIVSSPAEKRLLLVKTPNAQITTQGLFCEIYGNLLAREFGVTTPRPALVRIGSDFVAAMKLSEATKHIPLTPGIAAGCDYLRGLAPVIPSAFRNNEETADVQAIYGVDLLIQNPDRRPEKPNCALYQGGIVAFDFELAFSFLLPLIGKQPGAWAVHEQGICTGPLFYRELKTRQADLDWTPFLKTLRSLREERLAALFASLPSEWRSHADKVTAHLCAVRDHAAEFEKALTRSLL